MTQGGDNQPALNQAEVTEDLFPVGTKKTDANIFKQAASTTKVWTMSSDYTQFGVWFRAESGAANAKAVDHAGPRNDADEPLGADSPGSYAYSWLEQSSCHRDRVEQTYPSSGVATYTGTTLAILNTAIFSGDAEVKVTWDALPAAADGTSTSTVLPKFTNLRDIANDDPLRYGSQAANSDDPIFEEITCLATNENSLVVQGDPAGLLQVMVSGANADALLVRLALSTRTGLDATTDLDGANGVFETKFVGRVLKDRW